MGCSSSRSNPRNRRRRDRELQLDPIVPGAPNAPNAQANGTINKCVIAIDFGTTRSAFAFGFQGNETSTIEVGVPQDAVKSAATDIKAETTVLISEASGEAIGFGYIGKQTYVANEGRGLLLFEKFKMGLKDIRSDTDDPPVTDRSGKTMRLSQVMIAALSYLSEHALLQVRASTRFPVSAQNVEWIITVPAIWSEAANFFMRRAAAKAGMVPDMDCERLTLVKEPEGACMDYLERISTGNRGPVKEFSVGMQILVLDCGGGTNDMTFIKIDSISPMIYSELKGPAGGDGGAAKINDSFNQMLHDVFEEKFAEMEKLPNMVVLMQHWEEHKQGFRGPDDTQAPFRADLKRVCTDLNIGQMELSSRIERYNRMHSVQLTDNGHWMMTVPGKLVGMWFDAVINGMIVRDLIYQLSNNLCNDISVVYLVGGFCSNHYFQSIVERAIRSFQSGKVRTVFAEKSSIAIVRGAVLAKMRIGSSGRNQIAGVSESDNFECPCLPWISPIRGDRDPIHDVPIQGKRYLSESYGMISASIYNPSVHHGAVVHNHGERDYVHHFVMFAQMGTHVQYNSSTKSKMISPTPGSKAKDCVRLKLCCISDPTVDMNTIIYEEDHRIRRKAFVDLTFDPTKAPEEKVAYVAIHFGFSMEVTVTDKDGNPFGEPVAAAVGGNTRNVGYFNE